MNIVISGDDNYSPYIWAVVLNVLQKHGDLDLNFFVLDLNISKENKNETANLVNKYKKNISFISMSDSDFNKFPKVYLPTATYARLKMAEYINEDKVIYLDGDIYINGSLSELWNTDLQGKSIGACFDSWVNTHEKEHLEKLNISSNEYINAGILLIDLKRWRDIDVFNKSVKWVEDNIDLLKFQDQDILNALFRDDIYYLDCRYNFMPELQGRYKNWKKGKLQLNVLEKATMPVVISHYCGFTKPWHSGCTHINRNLYEKMIKNQLIPDGWNNKFEFEKVSLRTKLKHLNRYLRYRFLYGIY